MRIVNCVILCLFFVGCEKLNNFTGVSEEDKKIILEAMFTIRKEKKKVEKKELSWSEKCIVDEYFEISDIVKDENMMTGKVKYNPDAIVIMMFSGNLLSKVKDSDSCNLFKAKISEALKNKDLFEIVEVKINLDTGESKQKLIAKSNSKK